MRLGFRTRVVPMTDVQMASDRVFPRYWLAEALRSWDEGRPGLALRFAKVAVMELEDEVKGPSGVRKRT